MFSFQPQEGARQAARFTPPGVPTQLSEPLVGKRAPEFNLESLDGEKVRHSDHAGHVVLLEFWATWCGQCLPQLPALMALQDDYGEQGLVVLSLSIDEDAEAVRRYLRRHPLTVPVLMADEGVRRDYGNINGVPCAFLVDKQGVVRRAGGSFSDVRERIEELLGE